MKKPKSQSYGCNTTTRRMSAMASANQHPVGSAAVTDNRLQRPNVSFSYPAPPPANQFVSLTQPTVPASSAYQGEYGFEISFQHQPKETKSATWTYSDSMKKLFVRMSSTCPVRFKTSSVPPPGSVIRALPTYIKPEHIQEVVRRCPNHATKQEYNETSKHDPNHLLWCEHKRAVYFEDTCSGRLSVIIPHEQPQAGTEWVTNLFQFMCFSSCVGGLNRRPIQVIFTLEHNNIVLGRQSVEVRICACPGRDRRSEESTAAPSKSVRGKTVKAVRRPADSPTSNYSLTKRQRLCPDDEEIFTLTVYGKEHFELLRHIRDSLELASLIPSAQREQLLRHQSSSGKKAIALQVSPSPSFRSGFGDVLPSLSLATSAITSTPFFPSPVFSSQEQTVRYLDSYLESECYIDAGLKADDEITENEVTSSSTTNHCLIPDQNHQQIQSAIPQLTPETTVTRWLGSLDLSTYVDIFHQQGYYRMSELQNFSLEDLQKMKIAMQNRNQIWKSLVEYQTSAKEVDEQTILNKDDHSYHKY